MSGPVPIPKGARGGSMPISRTSPLKNIRYVDPLAESTGVDTTPQEFKGRAEAKATKQAKAGATSMRRQRTLKAAAN